MYDPVMEGRLVARPLPRTKVGLARKAAAACATMAVSGAVHELIFAYIAPIPPTGKWMAFFTLQVGARHRTCLCLLTRSYAQLSTLPCSVLLTADCHAGCWVLQTCHTACCCALWHHARMAPACSCIS